jgi:hypothetical protein
MLYTALTTLPGRQVSPCHRNIAAPLFDHLISARNRSVGEIVMPGALAAFTFTASSSHNQTLRISSPGTDKVHLMGPCNHGELQWSTMSDWTYR